MLGEATHLGRAGHNFGRDAVFGCERREPFAIFFLSLKPICPIYCFPPFKLKTRQVREQDTKYRAIACIGHLD